MIDPATLTGEYLYNLKQHTGKTRAEIAEMVGLSMGAVGGRIWRYRQTLNGSMTPEDHAGLQLFNIILGQPLELTGDFVVVSDVQAPTVHLDFARLVMPTAQRYGIREMILLGDFLNMDYASLYPIITPHPQGTSEIAAARYLIDEWLQYFTRIIWLPGNHEDRWLKLNRGNFEMKQLASMITKSDRVEVSNFDHCWIDTPRGRWFCCHGTNYSINQLVVADQLAQKYQAHVICGHQHHLAMGWDRYKHYMIVDNGGLFDADKMAYVSMRASKFAGMQIGFSLLKDGYPALFGPEPFTDWQTILEDAA
jgi:hypothetical protein